MSKSPRSSRLPQSTGPLFDSKVNAVLDRLEAARRYPTSGGPRTSEQRDPHAYQDFGFSIHPEQGDLIYLLCRALGAKRVAEFATSVGVSTIYFAAAIRDDVYALKSVIAGAWCQREWPRIR